jgi:hypothetical protein
MCPENSAQQSLLNLLYQLVQTHFFPDFLLHVFPNFCACGEYKETLIFVSSLSGVDA